MSQWEGVSEFVAVVEQGSFTRAAALLAISIAQVSRQVSQLENRLAVKLLYRTTRKVTVTEPGQIYYQHCKQVLEGLDEAERALQHLHSSPRGRLKITAPITYGERKIAPLLNQYAVRYPELEVQCRLSNQKIDLVESGFDLAIRLGQLDDSSMMARQLGSRSLLVCASHAYINRFGAPSSSADLAQHNCLRGIHDYWRFSGEYGQHNLNISGNYSCNNGNTLLDAALQGIGIIQLPDYYVAPYLERGQLVELLPNNRPEVDGVWALYPQNRHLSPKIRGLIDFLAQQLALDVFQ